MHDDWPTATPRPGDTLDITFLRPLVETRIGDPTAEQLVSHVTDNKQTVTTLIELVSSWTRDGFPLMHDGTLTGKHHELNYKSATETYRAQTHKSLLKRLDTHKTLGPFAWTGNVQDLPFPNCAINSVGAVPYKYELDRARACDDPVINAAVDPHTSKCLPYSS